MIQAKSYANKKSTNGEPNRVNVMMSMEEAKEIAERDKAKVAELVKAVSEVAK